jgi:hypothetical protein
MYDPSGNSEKSIVSGELHGANDDTMTGPFVS